MNPDFRRPTSKIVALAAAALSVIGVACGDFTGVPASLPTLTDSGTVYALNGAPPGAPPAPVVDQGETLDRTRRELIQAADERKAQRNSMSAEVARRKRAGEPADDL